jgi:hypothetical protein
MQNCNKVQHELFRRLKKMKKEKVSGCKIAVLPDVLEYKYEYDAN